MANDRATALRLLIAYRLPIEPTIAELASFGWDSERALATVTATDVMTILERYIRGELTAEQVTDWADLIECREDIEVMKNEQYVQDIIFRLANPNLNEAVTVQLAGNIQAEIRHAQSAV